MAYAVLLASIPDDQLIAFRQDQRQLLDPELLVVTSHLLTDWVYLKELQEALGRAIDGGEMLRFDLWHPLRSPLWHPPATTAEQASHLSHTWNEQLAINGPVDSDDWYGIEIAKVLRLFKHAARRNNGVVSVLEPPMDKERAQKVTIPLAHHPSSNPSG